jgi:hypothetical protein
MGEPKTPPTADTSAGAADKERARERELRELVERVENTKGKGTPSPDESPHDFVERKRREGPDKR